MIRGGRTGKVYRTPQRNAHGDAIDAQGNVIRVGANGTELGEVKGIIMGGLSASPALARGEYSSTESQIGIPNKNAIKVKFGDRILIDGVLYKVVSAPMWDYSNSLSGTKPEYHWVRVEGTVD
ncbi:head-to-tail stopper [Mycobacterium phage Skinny]|uniref:Head-to-tail stopper n=6 Tax=Bongovirus bongo TaxID=1983750 RepID=A0A0M4R052_9CAUD|nr:head-tail connector protein [Mycobacterium phage PegLeg]YP_009604878.1 head-tail connector protein [Mycobacterium phage Bongo]ALF00548.1 head-to-tail stopper [Mycobacterium phage Bricole]AXQ52661.1 head-to-tail stopper [Mycobacterium phage IPhane7]QDH93593.1 head-to-tail stopper [Mycobacterium phage LilhomieP]QGJ93167.1 head-to-tail stopper [Mycobacterium phage TyDawg]QUU29220.1 head-to-tail stopper [Mycobacterium phage SirSheldon]UXE05228.1 head-to-tail stopper [Mycobacterium phage Skinn